MNLPRRTYSVILLGALVWCSAILLTPYLAATAPPLGKLCYLSFHPLCHQMAERSFHLFGEKLAVCSRCTSIYVAFLAGTLLYPLLRRAIVPRLHDSLHPRSVLLVAMLPMLVDVVAEFLGVHSSTFLTRSITGALFGFVVSFILLPTAIEGVQQLFTLKKNPTISELKERTSPCK